MIRLVKKKELDWVNQKYQEVGFLPSSFEKEKIFIKEKEKIPMGLGRLVTLSEKEKELGGIFVFKEFQGQGIAKEIVSFILKTVKKEDIIYCIPFLSLVSFYESFGFIPVSKEENFPQVLLDKISFCKKTYKEPVSLLYQNAPKRPLREEENVN